MKKGCTQSEDVGNILYVSNLKKFNEFTQAVLEKWERRRAGEIWTRQGGERVVKLPDGQIIPYHGKESGGRGDDEDDAKSGEDARKKAEKIKALEGLRAFDLGLKLGPNGELISPHFRKSEEVLEKLVREMLSRLGDGGKCVLQSDMLDDEKSNPDYRDGNKGVCMSEGFAEQYGLKGLRMVSKSRSSKADKKFILATALVYGDLIDTFVHKRSEAIRRGV